VLEQRRTETAKSRGGHEGGWSGRLAEAKRWLFAAWTPLLPENVGEVIGAESASGGLVDGPGHGVGTVLTDEFEKFGDLARQRAIAIGNVAEIRFQRRFRTESVEKGDQPVLGARIVGWQAGTRPVQLRIVRLQMSGHGATNAHS